MSSDRREGGYTLMEMLIAISIIGLIGAVLTHAFITSFNSSSQVAASLRDSTARQSLVDTLTADIQEADDLWRSEDPSCVLDPDDDFTQAEKELGAVHVDHVLRMHRADFDSEAMKVRHRTVAYYVVQIAQDRSLRRLVCRYSVKTANPATPLEEVRSKPTVMARSIGGIPVAPAPTPGPELPTFDDLDKLISITCPPVDEVRPDCLGETAMTEDLPVDGHTVKVDPADVLPGDPAGPAYQLAVTSNTPTAAAELVTVVGHWGTSALDVYRPDLSAEPHRAGQRAGHQPKEIKVWIPYKGGDRDDPACPAPLPLMSPRPGDRCLQISAARRNAAGTPDPLADLEMKKTGPNPAYVGPQGIEFALAVLNKGPNRAFGVEVKDTLEGVDFLSASEGCLYAADPGIPHKGVLTCTRPGDLLAGDLFSNTVTVTAAEPFPGYTNTATAGSVLEDPDTVNNVSKFTTEIKPAADLELTQTIDMTRTIHVEEDQPTYTLKVKNLGPSPATNVTFTDTLPAGAVVVEAAPGCSGSAVVTCNIANLAVNEEQTRTIKVKFTTPGSKQNAVALSATPAEDDLVPENNSPPPIDSTVVPAADLSVTIDEVNTVEGGSEYDYVMKVANDGPSPATSVELTIELDAELDLVSATPGQGTCAGPAGNTVTCNLGTIASGAPPVAITVRVIAPDGPATVHSTASVDAAEDDLHEPNGASVDTTVEPPPPPEGPP